MFYQLFLGDCCLGKQCYEHCKYKYDHSSADIRIGDLWGNTYKNDEDGVSCAIAFTKQGNEVLKLTNCDLTEHSFDVVAEGQMKTCAIRPVTYRVVYIGLHNKEYTILDICNRIRTFRKMEKIRRWILHPCDSIKNKMYWQNKKKSR